MRVAAFVVLLLGAREAVAAPTTKECIAANESAIEHRAALELRAARADLIVCASSSCPAAIQSECARRFDDVEHAMPSLVLAADDGAGNDLANVKVTLDGVLLAEHLDPAAIPVDPGPHEIRFETAGFPPATRAIVVREGEKNRRERVTFARPRDKTTTTKSPAWRIAGIATAGAGVVGLISSGVFAGLAASSWSSSQQACASPSMCADHAKALSDHDAAAAQATISTIALVSGAGLVVAGAIVFFAAPTVSTRSSGGIVGIGSSF